MAEKVSVAFAMAAGMPVQSTLPTGTICLRQSLDVIIPQNKKSARGMPRANYYMVIVGTAYRAVNKVF
ncbi:hypothetical protein D0784_14265 [Vibrio campbellii]|nr:hypothetical protein D0784_14265 [Vibrio campbellii]